MAKGLSAAKAKKILKDGYVKGKPLTAKQIKYFGAIANGATPMKAIDGADIEKAQLGKILKLAKKMYDGAKKVEKFDSSIDWAKWNKAIPENKALMKEYNAIEEATKKNGTWMKNPDGSAFKGSPEQFVQQQSENFKKAFPNALLDDSGSPLINYHGSGSKFDVFDESKFYSGTYGKGVYTSPNKDAIVESYANPNKNRTKRIAGESGTDEATENLYELYINSKNPLTTDDILDFRNFGKTVDELPSLKDWKNSDFGKKMLAENTYLKTDDDIISFIRMNTPNDPVKESFIDQGGDFLRAVDTKLQEGVTPFSNQMKSTKGNDGMFDMTNPNIYKAIVPGAIGAGAASQMTGPVREDGQFKNGGWLDKFDDGGSVPKAQTGMMYARTSGMSPEEPKKAQNGVDYESVKNAIRNVESLDGKLMWNPESTATGLYGQRFSEIKNDYPGTRKDFVKDTVAQNKFFKRRFYDGLEASETTPLLQDANDLYNDYSPQIKNFPYSKEDIAVLSNFIGRGGTRKYLGYAIRDGKPLAEALPNIYGPSAKQSNKTPEEYLEVARQYYKTNEFKNGGRCWPGYKTVSGKTPFSKGSCQKAQDGISMISQYEEPAWYEKLLDYAASPMTTLGYLAKGQDLPDRLPINVPERSEFDNWNFDAYNPAAYIKYGASAKRNFEKGEYFDAAFDALGAIPILPAFLKRGKKPVKAATKAAKNVGKNVETEPLRDLFIQPNIYPTSGPLPKNMEPYLSRRVYPFNKEQEVFESFLSNDRQLKNIDSKSINYDADGNIIPKAQIGKMLKKANDLYKIYKSTNKVVDAANTVKKTDKVVSNSLNPLDIADQIIPRFNVLGPVGGDIMQLSPLNAIPFYGKNLKGKNMAFRKFGNSIYDVIQRQALSPVGGSDFRMGKNQIVSEGNWAAMSRPSENYSGVFEATFDFNNPFANLSPTGIRQRNGVLITDKLGRRLTEIPLTEPGLSFNRRLPFSTRYVPIDKQKLIDDKPQLATFGPRLQSLVEKYGIGLLGAHLVGEEDTYNKYTIDPVIENSEKLFNDLKKMKSDDDNKNELKDGGWLSKYENGGVIEDDRGQWAYPGEITKINSNNITMKGVNYPVLGISNTGDKKMMQPGKDYKFDGNSVTEYPMAKDGKSLVELNQLTNFTNYNTPQPGGWLNKYN